MAYEMTEAGLPNTFVPGRNLLFLTYAAALAYRRGSRHARRRHVRDGLLRYPDCRNGTLQTLAKALSLGLDKPLGIATPLMWIDKAGTWAMAEEIGGQPSSTSSSRTRHTCYQADRTHRHAWGYGCGTCPACDLRAKGWDRWQTASH